MKKFLLVAAFCVLVASLPVEAAYLVENTTAPSGDEADVVFEGFENATFPSQPTSIYYTRATSGSSGLAQIDTTQFDEGSQSYLLDVNGAGTSIDLAFTTTTTNLCTAGGLRFAIRANDDVGGWRVALIQGTVAAPTNFVDIAVDMVGDGVTFRNDNSAGQTTSTANDIGISTAASTSWLHYGITCDGTTGATFVNYDTSQAKQLTGTAGGTLAPNIILFNSNGGGATGGPAIHIDDLQWGLALGGASFCADFTVENFGGVAEADYGYDYRRGGDFFTDSGEVGGSVGDDTGYEFQGDDDDESTWDYAAKHFTTGTKALHYNVTLETLAEGVSSVFRVNFHTLEGAVPDATQKGNGFNTQHFADHVEAQFLEDGNDWRITFWYVNAGGTRTQIGGSTAPFGEPNDQTQFTVWIDTRATANINTAFDQVLGQGNWHMPGGGFSFHTDPFLAVTTATYSGGPSGEDYAVLGVRYLDEISGNPFVDDTVGDTWLVGYGIAVPLLPEATTVLNNNEAVSGNYDSTCFFDDAGTMVLANSQGSTPGSQVPQSPPGDDDADPGSFNGISAEFLMGFLGIVLAAAFAASMNEKTGAGAAGIAVFSLMGIFLAYFLGYFELWVVVGFVIMGVAVIFIGIKSAASGGGGM